MDAVFPLGAGSRHGDEELRYALRSLALFCPWVERVFLVGEKPGWAAGVVHLPFPDADPKNKDTNIIGKLQRAARHPDLSPSFLFCSDDQLVARPCTPADFAPRYLPPPKGVTVWERRVLSTLARSPGSRFFQPHIWSILSGDDLLRLTSTVDWKKDNAVMSLYHNFVGELGTPDFDHTYATTAEFPTTTHVAYGDKAFELPEFRAVLAARFPAPCRWETK